MKKIVILIGIGLLWACQSNKKEQEIEALSIPEFRIERFDKAFYTQNNLEELKTDYTFFFPKNVPDSIWINKRKDPLLRELYTEVQKKYPTVDTIQDRVYSLFKHIKYYFPKQKLPSRVITLIAEVDYTNKTFYSDSIAFIALDLYLGKNHRFYEFPEYQKQTFVPQQMLPDLAGSFAQQIIPIAQKRHFLAQMIQAGKEIYLKSILVPQASEFDLMGYTPEQLQWCKENELQIWTYFMDSNLLYESDSKLRQRFIDPAPFSKFYLEIDPETPGKTGVWIGWQIVKMYMEKSEATPEQLITTDPETLFNQSKYKPRK